VTRGEAISITEWKVEQEESSDSWLGIPQRISFLGWVGLEIRWLFFERMKRMSVDAWPYRVKRAVYQRSKVTEDSDPRDRALIEYLEWREKHKIHVSGGR
jgi:hypothetical protein